MRRRTAGKTWVIEVGSTSSPTASIGTSESPARASRASPAHVDAGRQVRELPPPAAAETISSPAFGFASSPRPLAALWVVENGRVAAGAGRCEAQLGAVAARHRLLALAPEDDVDGVVPVEPAREHRDHRRVDHPGAVRGRHDLVGEDVLEPPYLAHGRLAVIRADDDRVALEELLRASSGFDQRPHGLVRSARAGVGGVGPCTCEA